MTLLDPQVSSLTLSSLQPVALSQIETINSELEQRTSGDGEHSTHQCKSNQVLLPLKCRQLSPQSIQLMEECASLG